MELTLRSEIKQKGTNAVVCSVILVMFMILTHPVRGTGLNGWSVSASARFDTASIRIGEQTRFTVTLEQPDEIYVYLPEFNDTLAENIEILSATGYDTLRLDDNNLRITKSYNVTSFYGGRHTVQSIPLVFSADDAERVLHTRPADLEVLSPEIDRESSIYDIKDPFAVSLGFREILPWIIIAAILVFLGWYWYRYLRKRKEGQPAFESRKPLEPLEPAHVIAMKELRELKSESLWQKGMVKEYYTRLTEIIRRYIERRFGITAMERTSREIVGELNRTDGLAKEVVKLLEQCFLIADLVKFARVRPGEEQHEMSMNTAFHFVKATCDPGSGTDAVIREVPAGQLQPEENNNPSSDNS